MKKRMMAAPALLLGALLMGPATSPAQMSTTSQSTITNVGTASDRSGAFHIDRFEKRGRKIYAVGWFSGVSDTLTSYYLRDTPVWIGTPMSSSGTLGSMDVSHSSQSSAAEGPSLNSTNTIWDTPTSSSLGDTLSPNSMTYGSMYGPAVPDYGYFWSNQDFSADTLALGYGVIPDTTTSDGYDTTTNFGYATGGVNSSMGVTGSVGGNSYGYNSTGSLNSSFGGGTSFSGSSNLSGYSSYDESSSDNTGISPGFSNGGSTGTNLSNYNSDVPLYDSTGVATTAASGSLGAGYDVTPSSIPAGVPNTDDWANGSMDATLPADSYQSSASTLPSTTWSDDWANWNGDGSVTITSNLDANASTGPMMMWNSAPNSDDALVTVTTTSPATAWNGVDLSRIQDQSGMVALPVTFAGASCDAVHLTLGPADSRNSIVRVGNPTTVHATSVGPFDVELSDASLGTMGNGQSICELSKLINGDGARTALVDKLNALIGAPTVGPVRNGTMK